MDGEDYTIYLFVCENEFKEYRKCWPDLIIVRLPVRGNAPMHEIFRESVKLFGEENELDWIFTIDDTFNIAYK